MKRYAISYIDFFDNQMQMMITEAENELEALYNGYDYFVGDNFLRTNISNVKDFQQEMFNSDAMMGVIEI